MPQQLAPAIIRPAPRPARSTFAAGHIELDERLVGELIKCRPFRPLNAQRRPRVPWKELAPAVQRGLPMHKAATAALAGAVEELRASGRSSAMVFRNTIIEFLDLLLLDFDWLPTLLSRRSDTPEYLYQHCVNTALLSMAVAAQLGMDRRRMLEVGLGGLLHDLGMLAVPPAIRCAPRPLTAEERGEVQRHPLYTLDMLGKIEGLSDPVKIVGYQAHERLDGGGYPRRQPSAMIHPYAKITAVADVYAAMTAPRPHRHAHLPYAAAKSLLLGGGQNRFDRAVVRALLDCLSLFPIGSAVELSDGRRARVVRANTGQHTRPIVEITNERGQPTGRIIDLSAPGDLKVVFALHCAQKR